MAKFLLIFREIEAKSPHKIRHVIRYKHIHMRSMYACIHTHTHAHIYINITNIKSQLFFTCFNSRHNDKNLLI